MKIVVVVFVGLSWRLFCSVHWCRLFSVGCMLFCAVVLFACVDVTVVSSAYEWRFVFVLFGVGMSAV